MHGRRYVIFLVAGAIAITIVFISAAWFVNQPYVKNHIAAALAEETGLEFKIVKR